MLTPALSNPAAELARLQRRLERERQARLEAERIAEDGLRQLYEQQRQLQLLEAIAVAANQAGSLRDILQFAVTRICQYTGWPLGHAYLVDRADAGRLHPTSIWYGNGPGPLQDFCLVTENTCFDRGQGLPGRVLASSAAAWIVDIGRDPNFLRADAVRGTGLKSAFALPVLAGDAVTAVLEFFHTVEAEPDAALLHVLSQVGVQLGRVVERQFAEERLHHDAFHDTLTGLPNRTLFLDRLQRAVARRQRYPDYQFAVLFVDLDRFKIVNDSLGHVAGDRLITQIAPRLQHALRQDDFVARPVGRVPGAKDTLARLGGDEFTLLLDDIHDPSDAVRVAERIQDVLRQPFSVDDQQVYASASIGIVTSGGPQTADELLRNADLAMYRAKALGGGRCEFFDPSMHQQAVNRLMVENDLRRALEAEQFVLHFQPIVCLASGAIVGCEALVRWQKTPAQLVFPGDFIGVAEDTGLIEALDMWVLREACRTMRQWQVDFPRPQPLTVSVNLSARLFAQADIAAQVQAVLAYTDVAPGSLRLEITESMSMGDAEHSVQVLSRLTQLGVRLSIDDFGTGYSSLSYLHRFPADILKIDRSFVNRLDQGAESVPIITSILSLARNLGMRVVAEGPETPGHVAQLQALGCDYGQGYHFSRPVPAAQFRELLAAGKTYPV